MLQKIKAGLCCLALCLIVTMQVNAAESAAEETSPFDPIADEVLKSMDAYLKSQKSLSLKAESLLDIVTEDGQILTFTTQLDVSLKRPDKLYAKRVGIIRNQEIFYNGSKLLLHSLQHNVYAEAEVPSTIGTMMDFATSKLGLVAPGSDLFYDDLYDGMMSDAVSSVYLGKVMIDGVECHHLAYRGGTVDFQLWIEAGAEAKPKRYMIVSKEMPGAPRYTINMTSLVPAEFTPEKFEFTPAPEEKRIQFHTEENTMQVNKAKEEPK